MDQKDDEEERFLRDIPGVEMCRGIGVVHHFSHTTRGRTVFAISPYPSTIQIMLLKTDIPRENEPGTGDRGTSFVENLAWIYFRMEEDDWDRIFIIFHFSFYENFVLNL